jgi:putative FmdB family regulatory protein
MPLYEYKCASCGKTFEVIQKFADEPLKVHPECGGEVARLFSAPAFHLKGTGWYATDYAKKSNGGSDSKSKSDSDSKSDSKPNDDAKPAASTETKESRPAAASESKSTETKPSTTA